MLVEIETNDLFDVLQAMKQKETLLGMHRKTFRLVLNTQNNIHIAQPKKQAVPQIDITKLPLEEQVELMDMIQITARSESEMHGVILAQPKQQETIDTEVELIENNNIKRLEQFVKKDNSNAGSTLDDIQKRIQQKLINAANRK